MPKSPSPSSTGSPQSATDSAAASASSNNAKLSGLDTLSLAATAALDERGGRASEPSNGLTAGPSSENQPNNNNNNNHSQRRKQRDAAAEKSLEENDAPGGTYKHRQKQGAHKSSASPQSDSSRLALLSHQAEGRANNSNATPGPETRDTSVSPSQASSLPKFSALLHEQQQAKQDHSSNSNPGSASNGNGKDLQQDNRWSYPQHTAAAMDSGNSAIHPQLAAMSAAAAVASAAESQLPGLQSLMSIANLTSPMYKPVLPKSQQDQSPTSGLKRNYDQHQGGNGQGLQGNGHAHQDASGGSPAPNGQARKKRQCSECEGWFSNLATHKSTHLTDTSRPHTCEVCKRGFARPNDLFRHVKSHRGEAPFRCPYFVESAVGNHVITGNSHGRPALTGFSSSELLALNGHGPHANASSVAAAQAAQAAAQAAAAVVVNEPACHQNGGFSRCDTYKNHLKAMHFEYPPGTKKKERAGMHGLCKACGMGFANSEVWITRHVEISECTGIPKRKEDGSDQ